MASESDQQTPQHIVQTRASVYVPDRLHQTRGAHPDRHGDCGICMNRTATQDTTLTHVNCMVSFHSECYEPWLQEGNKSCPNCRGTLLLDDLYEALETIPNFQMLADIPPDMDSHASKWQVVDIEPDMEEEDWDRIEEARMPPAESAQDWDCDEASLTYWTERGEVRARLGEESFNSKPDFAAQQVYRQECNRASTVYYSGLRSACQRFLKNCDSTTFEIQSQMTSRKYMAHYDLWSHTIEQQIARETNPNDPEVETRIAQFYDSEEPQTIQKEFEEGLEPLKQILYTLQVEDRMRLMIDVDEAKCNYRDSLRAARVKLEVGDWPNNPPDPADFPDCNNSM